jgi:nicotinamidase/pyrazinamidase
LAFCFLSVFIRVIRGCSSSFLFPIGVIRGSPDVESAMEPIDRKRTCLLVVDVQQGFTPLCPEELPVPGGLDIVPQVNELLRLPWRRVDASQDWHPPGHCSFHGQRDNLYPPHCVQGTPGADFVPGLLTARFHTIWRKGFEPDRDAYALTVQHPHYADMVRAEGITTVVVCGLATNICCYFTSRDLRQAGFRVLLVEDASAGIDVPAAGLFQDRTREEGQALGIEYTITRAVCQAVEYERSTG